MNAHFPPFTKPTGAYDAAKLREDTIALAVSQDRDNDALPSILADMRAVVARLERYAERKPPSSYETALSNISAATRTKTEPPTWDGDPRSYGYFTKHSFINGQLVVEHIPLSDMYLAPSAEGLDTRIIKANPQPECEYTKYFVEVERMVEQMRKALFPNDPKPADPEHLAWHVTGDGADFSVERDSAGSRL